MSKIKLTSFDGVYPVLGVDTEVAYVAADGEDHSVLIIKGLSIDKALEAINRLGVNQQVDAGPLVSTKGVKTAEKPQSVADKEPSQENEPAKTNGSADLEDLAIGDAKLGGADILALGAMTKVRPVIELLSKCGYDTPEKVVAVARKIKAQVPALQTVEAGGNFDKRMERAALTVMSPAPA